jgi:hypothetical protein
MWAGLLALHVLFWSTQRPIQLGLVVPAFALLATRRLRSEPYVWAAVTSVMIAVFVVAPAAFSTSALLAALTLARHALSLARSLRTVEEASPAGAAWRGPYRASGADAERTGDADAERTGDAAFGTWPTRGALSSPLADREGRVRLLSGALVGVYLAAWTLDWTGGALPAHVVALDGALLASVLLMVWRLRARLALAPLTATLTHAAVVSGVVPPPRTPLEWGGAAVALGFALLGASLATSYRLRHFPARGPDPGSVP